jgi:hypothetical protein
MNGPHFFPIAHPPKMIFKNLTLPFVLLGTLVATGTWLSATPADSATPTTLVCIEELVDCPGEQVTIRITQVDEVTVVTFEFCGEVFTSEVPSISSDPICGDLTCCSTGYAISPCGELTDNDTSWGDVTVCDDYIVE